MLHDSVLAPMRAWTDFYVIVGSAAAALTGLMFVVITLIANVRAQSTRRNLGTFSTPTVVQYSVALGISAVLAAPWPTLYCPALLLAAAGAGGLWYAIRVHINTFQGRSHEDYQPDLEDRFFYLVLPTVAYATLLLSAVMLPLAPHRALFGLAAVTLLVIFGGIHNAWDIVTYVTARWLTNDSDDPTSPADGAERDAVAVRPDGPSVQGDARDVEAGDADGVATGAQP